MQREFTRAEMVITGARPLILLLFYSFWSPVSSKMKPLQGKNLLMQPIEVPGMVMLVRNQSGQIVAAKGPGIEVINYISQSLGFTYSLSNDKPTSFGVKTISAVLFSRGADVLLSAIVPTSQRMQEMSFSYPWSFGSYALVIPYPESTPNIGAPWKPFELKVWILLIISAAILMALLLAMSYTSGPVNQESVSDTPNQVASEHQMDSYFKQFRTSSEYLVAAFLGQGGVCYPSRLCIRIVAATWCLAAFVLVNVYNTTIVSYVTSPIRKPLVDSINDIPQRKDLRIVVDLGWAIDVILSNAESGILKELGDMLREDPSLRCNVTEECLQKVKSGSHIFAQSYSLDLYYINEDLKKTGKCSMTVARDTFLFYFTSFAFPKGSPNANLFSKEIIRLQEMGFTQLWDRWYGPRPRKCLDVSRQKLTKPRISLPQLTSAFALLLGGYTMAFVMFAAELALNRYRN